MKWWPWTCCWAAARRAAACECVLSIVDASNLERNLYLVSQVLALGLPTVVALNMIDVAADRGMAIDVAKLQTRLGVAVVPVQANRRQGLAELGTALAAAVAAKPTAPADPFPKAFRKKWTGCTGCSAMPTATHQVDSKAPGPKVPGLSAAGSSVPAMPRYLVERLLLDTAGYLEGHLLNGDGDRMHAEVRAARERLAAAGCPVPAVEAMARYEWVGRVLDGVVSRPAVHVVTGSDKIDRVLTHKLWGTLIFVLLMLMVFTAVFVVAAPAMDLISGGINAVGDVD